MDEISDYIYLIRYAWDAATKLKSFLSLKLAIRPQVRLNCPYDKKAKSPFSAQRKK
jgi:hypothetical protein